MGWWGGDHLSQLRSLTKMGGIARVMGVVPGMSDIVNEIDPSTEIFLDLKSTRAHLSIIYTRD